VWGVNAPIAALAAQIHQESYWKPAAVSRTGALTMAQFMPATADWLEGKHKSLATLARASSAWAFYAQSLYMRELHDRVPVATDRCEKYCYALLSYVGGERWMRARQKLSSSPQLCMGVTNRINPGIKASNQREAQHYPERILGELEPLYMTWGPGACHK